METTAQSFSYMALILPLLLTPAPAAFFYMGRSFSRKDPGSFTGRTLYWLGGHGITLVLVALLTSLRGAGVPDMVVTQLPLLITLVYIVAGFLLRSPFIFSLGLATPGLWLFFTSCWEAFSGAESALYVLPREPFWYLLAAVIIFCLQYLRRPKELWEASQTTLMVLSGSYLMGAFWLLALGRKSLLGTIGLPQYYWSIGLLAVSGALLWCARHLRDPLLGTSSAIGLSAGVYCFISFFPWG